MSSPIIMQFPKPRGSSGATPTGGQPEHCSSQTGRRSGGYKPSLWDFDAIQSLNNTHYDEEMHQKRVTTLIDQVKMLLSEEMDDVRLLELIDDLRRLGISYHFDGEIKRTLTSINSNQKYVRDLYSTSLGFRLLRQHGFDVSQEIFGCFMDANGSAFDSSLCDDTKGLLQLYEASFLSRKGEDSLDMANEFSAIFLQKKLDDLRKIIDKDDLLSSVRDAFKLPIHWKVQKLNIKSFIDAYKKRPDMNPVVLELAKLDINIVQAEFQQELKEVSRWWNSVGLAQQLPFVRDRIVECYYWTTGCFERRQHRYERIMATKIFALVTVIDDIFDIYGTLQELRLFTSAVQRWDIESMKQLPPYMQLSYLALYNFVNESTYHTLMEKGFNSIPYLHKTWVDLIEAYMREAEWYYKGNKPSMEEYIDNAWISIGCLPIMSHTFFRLTERLENESAERMHEYHDMVRGASTVGRLADDLATSLDEAERGDVPKSVQCYMNENNVSEEEAREHVRRLINHTWKTMINKDAMSVDPPFSKYYVEALANMARTAQFIYQDDSDGFGMQHSKVNKMLRGLLFESYA